MGLYSGVHSVVVHNDTTETFKRPSHRNQTVWRCVESYSVSKTKLEEKVEEARIGQAPTMIEAQRWHSIRILDTNRFEISRIRSTTGTFIGCFQKYRTLRL